VGDGDGLVFLGQVAWVDDVDAGGYEKAAGSADEDEALDVGLVESGDEGAGSLDEVVHFSCAGSVGADDGVGSDGLGGNVCGVDDISLDGIYAGLGGDLEGSRGMAVTLWPRERSSVRTRLPIIPVAL
jgi:hypothetical protein